MNFSSENIALSLVVVVVLCGAVYAFYCMQGGNTPVEDNSVEDNLNMEPEEVAMEEALEATEGFQNQQHTRRSAEDFQNEQYEQYEDQQENFQNQQQYQQENFENPQPTGGDYAQLPSECYPKDVLTSSDLLPRNANSLHAQVVPSGQGALTDQNFLTAGYHTGINTVGQSLKNANLQLRSEPPNPQVKVSIWNQSTIEPDTNRRPLEIGGF